MAKLYSSPLWEEESRVAHLVTFFQRTGNVAAAWTCWHIARTHGLNVPDSVAAEIDRFAAAIAGVVDSPDAGTPGACLDNRSVGRLWAGDRGGRGKKEPAGEMAEWQRDVAVSVDVYRRRWSEESEASAVAAAANARGMSESAVRAAVRRYRFDDDDLSEK